MSKRKSAPVRLGAAEREQHNGPRPAPKVVDLAAPAPRKAMRKGRGRQVRRETPYGVLRVLVQGGPAVIDLADGAPSPVFTLGA